MEFPSLWSSKWLMKTLVMTINTNGKILVAILNKCLSKVVHLCKTVTIAAVLDSKTLCTLLTQFNHSNQSIITCLTSINWMYNAQNYHHHRDKSTSRLCCMIHEIMTWYLLSLLESRRILLQIRFTRHKEAHRTSELQQTRWMNGQSSLDSKTSRLLRKRKQIKQSKNKNKEKF